MQLKYFLFCAAAILLPTRDLFAADPTSGELIAESARSAGMISSSDEKANALIYLILPQAKIGDVAGAKRAADLIADPVKRNYAYGSLGCVMAEAGDIKGATAMIDLAGQNAKAKITASISIGQAKKGDIAAAKATAAGITDNFYKAQADETIALTQAAAGDFKGAEATVSAIGVGDTKIEAYGKLCEKLAKAGEKDECRQMIDLMKAVKDTPDNSLPPRPRSMVNPVTKAHIAAAETIAGNLAAAMEIVNGASDPDMKSLIISEIASAQLRMGNIKESQATATQITNNYDSIIFTLNLAEAQLKSGDGAGAPQSIKSGIDLTAKIKDAHLRAAMSEFIGTVDVKVESLQKAVAWARSQEEPEVREHALIGIIKAMPDYQGPYLP